MKAILQHRSRRISFLLLVGSILIIIFLLRVYVIPYYYPGENKSETINYFISVLDKISISLIISVFIAWFLFKIEAPEDQTKYSVIEPSRIRECLEKGRIDTSFWYFSGGAGSYNRSVTIPKLHKDSVLNNKSISVKLLLINPFNMQVCDNYIRYRAPRRSSVKSNINWNHEYLQSQIISTICIATIYKSLNPMLEIEIFLKNNFSTMRIDINENNCIITKEDIREPALLSLKGTNMYSTYLEEIFHQAKQSLKLDIDVSLNDIKLGYITENQVKSICDHYKFNVKDAIIKKITSIINDNKSYYN